MVQSSKHQLIMHGQFISMLTYQQSNMCQETFVVHKLGKAQQEVRWPGFSRQLQEIIYKLSLMLQRMPPTFRAINELPNLPWKKVASDLFYWKASTSLLIVDYYSICIEISKLNGHSSSEIISHKINLC